MARSKSQESMFGDNFKYIVVLGVLAWMVYTLPSVREALAVASADSASDSLAAVLTAQVTHLPGFSLGMNDRGGRPLPPEASSSMQREKPMNVPGREPERIQKKELNPQQVVTLLFKLGFISQDKVDQARVAVDHYSTGSTTPPLPCVATSTVGFSGTSTMPLPCREIGKGLMPRLGTTTEVRMMKAQDDQR